MRCLRSTTKRSLSPYRTNAINQFISTCMWMSCHAHASTEVRVGIHPTISSLPIKSILRIAAIAQKDSLVRTVEFESISVNPIRAEMDFVLTKPMAMSATAYWVIKASIATKRMNPPLKVICRQFFTRKTKLQPNKVNGIDEI